VTIFTPTPFASPVLAPNVVSTYRAAPYITPSWYRYAPTAVSTFDLVPGSSNQAADSTASLANVISRASAMMDEYCFHRNDGSFSAFVSTEQMWAPIKPSGQLVLLANFKPIRAVVGLGMGPAASQLTDMDPTTATDITFGEQAIVVPGYWTNGMRGPAMFAGYPSANGQVLCVYSYIAGWPHTTLASSALAGATSITVNPSTPGGTTLVGAFGPFGSNPGTPLVIKDPVATETVTLASTPTGLTLELAAPLQYAHSVPPAPDGITVTTLPGTLEQACISIVSVILKMQGMRAQIPSGLGSASPGQRQAMGRAGVLSDWDAAEHAMKSYRTVYIHGIYG